MSLRGLYAITDSSLLAEGRLLPRVEAALAGGARLLQYRDKSNDAARRLDEASQLKALCERYRAQLLINDDLGLASQLQVGVHLGQEDGSLHEARAELGPTAIIGATCHASLDKAAAAVEAGVSYIAFGRFFNSNTKPGAPAATHELLQQFFADRFQRRIGQQQFDTTTTVLHVDAQLDQNGRIGRTRDGGKARIGLQTVQLEADRRQGLEGLFGVIEDFFAEIVAF